LERLLPHFLDRGFKIDQIWGQFNKDHLYPEYLQL
jgi:hypothetical protein